MQLRLKKTFLRKRKSETEAATRGTLRSPGRKTENEAERRRKKEEKLTRPSWPEATTEDVLPQRLRCGVQLVLFAARVRAGIEVREIAEVVTRAVAAAYLRPFECT